MATTRYRRPSGSKAHNQLRPPVADSPWSSTMVGAPAGPCTSRTNVVPRPGSSTRRPAGTTEGWAATAKGVGRLLDADDLDLEDTTGRLEVDDVTGAGTHQDLAERRAGRDHLEVVVALLDRADEIALDLVVALVADRDHCAGLHPNRAAHLDDL